MFELLGLLIVGGLVLFLIGVALKITWFVASLLLLPIKLIFIVGGLFLMGALFLLLLPATLVGILALVGGLAVLGMGALAIIF